MHEVAMNPADLFARPSTFNSVTVSPGLIGFIATFAVVVVTVLLLVDMSRRVRRMQARADVERREAEIAEAAGRASDTDKVADAVGPGSEGVARSEAAADSGAADADHNARGADAGTAAKDVTTEPAADDADADDRSAEERN
ncbi:hypothetical protein [Devriesea agamarum]|uniref:hypothetical protein n=1 Tax=Devriesea agamarum TaxID=472569 RepID=UPI00071D2799|nr:hypothetical protein [Devriesea agamarum]